MFFPKMMIWKILFLLVALVFYIFLVHGNVGGNSGLTNSEVYLLRNLFYHFKNETKTIDSVRQFVYENSEHKEPFHKKKWNSILMVKLMIARYKNRSNPPPHMTCGPRARSMAAILDTLGIKSYLVQVYTDNYDTFASHTFLDVYNSDTAKWEAHDPDYNLIYLDSDNNRVDAKQLISTDLDKIRPVYDIDNAKIKGWNDTNRILKKDYFESVMLWNAFVDGSSLLLINQDRFDLFNEKTDYTRTSKGKVNFLQWCNTVYKEKWGRDYFISLL